MRFLFLFISLYFITIVSFGQLLYKQSYPQETYKASPQNWGFAQDKDGTLFLANNDGIVTYDGQKWGLLPLPGNKYVFSLAIDRADNIFLGSYNELGYMQKQFSGSYKYHSLFSNLPASCKNIAEIQQTIIFHGNVFFNDMQNVLVYANGKIKQYPIANRWLYEGGGHLYLIVEKGLLEYNGKDFVNTPFSNVLNGIQVKRVTRCDRDNILILDNVGKLWTIALNTSKYQLRRFANSVYPHLKDTVVRKILTLDNGNYVICSGKELVIIDKNEQVINYCSDTVLGLDLNLAMLFQDATHNLWISSNGMILQCITSSPLSYYSKENGLKGTIVALKKHHHELYAGTSEGVFKMSKPGLFNSMPGLHGQVEQFFDFDDKLYVAHDSGVYVIAGKENIKIIGHPYVQSLIKLQGYKDKMIFGTYNTGIWLIKKQKGIWIKQKIQGFEDEARYMHQDEKGNIWISHNNKGIFKLKLNKTLDSVVSNTLYNIHSGLPSNINNRLQNTIAQQIVVTTENGIYNYDTLSDRFKRETKLSAALGNNTTIYSSAEGLQGDFYFWGARSKSYETEGVLKKQENGAFKSYFTPFNKIGVQTNTLRVDVDAPQLVVGPNEVWIGNSSNIIVYRPLQKTFFNENISIKISEVNAGDSVISGKIPRNQRLRIPFEQNKLTFQFASNFNEDNQKLNYQYMLKGFDQSWSPWLPYNTAIFTNLSEGDYVFIVKAINIYGQLSQQSSFSFHIIAPWYRKWWAYLLYIGILIGVFKGFLQLNLIRIKKQKLALNNIIQEKTLELVVKNEDILRKNLEITAQSDRLIQLNETKDKLFSIISHDLRGPIGQVDQSLKSIEQGLISFDEFESFLPDLSNNSGSVLSLIDNLLYWAQGQKGNINLNQTWFALSEVVTENCILFKQRADSKQIVLNNEVNLSILIFADKDMIKLVLRNLISNAIKFTNAGGRIDIGVKYYGDRIAVFVQDTGIGMTEDQVSQVFNNNVSEVGTAGEKGTGLGLSVSREFIERHGGTLNVESLIGKGSTFYFELTTFQ